MYKTRSFHFMFSLVACCLILLLAACGSNSTPTSTSHNSTSSGGTVTSSSTPVTTSPGSGGSSATPVTTTVPMPATQTSCPAAGHARVAVTAPLALGRHANIVYIVNEPNGSFTTGTLKRYDVATENKTEIVKLPNTSISEAQVSADGQWVLFVALSNAGQAKLQLIRMDGQGLQTLYCAASNTISSENVLWSTDQRLVVFNDNGGTYLLNITNGTLQLEVKPSLSGPPLNLPTTALPLTWLDTTRFYVTFSSAPIAPIDTLALVDTSQGPNQQVNSLTKIYQEKPTGNYPCWDVDSSYNALTLFVNQCYGIVAPNSSGSGSLGTREGPSKITTQPAKSDGPQQTIFTSSKLGIKSVRAISKSTLLLDVENFSENLQVDTSSNGLWKVHTDGTDLTRLTTTATGNSSSLNPFSQYPWSNVSRDGKLYAFQTATSQHYPYTYSLFFGSLNGGTPTTFASISDGTRLDLVGWTTM